MAGGVTARRIVLVLGRRDEPTDGVEDYAHHLAAALAARGWDAHVLRLAEGKSLRADVLWRRAARGSLTRGSCALVQYSALAWSLRGFPVFLPMVVAAVRRARGHIGLVVHDLPDRLAGRRRDRVRAAAQETLLRWVAKRARVIISPVPPEAVGWLRSDVRGRVHLVPVGSNISPVHVRRAAGGEVFTAAVFGVTGGERADREIRDVAEAVTHASARLGRLRLLVFGRGAIEAGDRLRARLTETVELHVEGVCSPARVSELMARSRAALFVRGGISNRRGSAIAAIAHGLPVVAYQGAETGPPITEAGVVAVPEGDVASLAEALVRIAKDAEWSDRLRRRSLEAYERHFCWEAIAEKVEEAVRCRRG